MKKILATTIAVGGIVLAGNALAFDTNNPTGNYYGYADFGYDDGFRGGQSVGGDGNNLFVMNAGKIDVYTVTISDSSKIDQHPDNPDATGPVVSRSLTYNKSITNIAYAGNSTAEIAVWDGAVHYMANNNLYSYDIATGNFVGSTATNQNMALLAYDEVNDVLYGAHDSWSRTVYRLDNGTWNSVFSYGSLQGSHMDGLEMVYDTDGTGYMYVSDMTSDFLGQLRLEDDGSFTETNLFSYNSTGGDVEGMGFGPLGHFWATDWDSVYEIGGGDLGGYTPPPNDVPEPATMFLFGTGLAGLAGLRRRKNVEK